jgi:CRISPR-associated endoribonuclease Cas6
MAITIDLIHGLDFMRCMVHITRQDGDSALPFDYQYGLSSVMYKKLSEVDKTFTDKLHKTRGFKFYSFSNLMFDSKITTENGFLFKHGTFLISSPDPEFIRMFAEGFLMTPEFNLNGVDAVVDKIEILPENNPGTKSTLKTLSPIYVKTMREIDGTLKEWDLLPTEGKFYDNLHRNLVERYQEFNEHPPVEDVFEINKVHWSKSKRVTIDGSFRRCILMEFDLSASPELMKFAYEAGLGEKQGMGFGCVEVLGGMK